MGTKKWVFISDQYTPLLTRPDLVTLNSLFGSEDVLGVDLVSKLEKQGIPFEVYMQGPGECMFVPSGTWHQVEVGCVIVFICLFFCLIQHLSLQPFIQHLSLQPYSTLNNYPPPLFNFIQFIDNYTHTHTNHSIRT